MVKRKNLRLGRKEMKIAIVTVYSSKNFGSYWQSRTLYDYISSLGHDVYFLDTESRDIKKGIKKPLTRAIIKSALKGDLKCASFKFNELKIFMENLKEVKTVNADTVRESFDYIIFGSDEIWNVSRENMKAFPVFWGKGFDKIKKISYAPSINQATEKQLIDCGFKEALLSFTKISVRDKYSREIISKIYNGEVEQVLDPTFLVESGYYGKIKYKKICEPYIAVYMFWIDDEMFRRLRKIADIMGKRLVRVGTYDSRFDQCVLAKNPFIYYLDADYVIANTFHGTAFAINFKKQLIVLNNNHVRKISELLEQFDLNDRDMEDKSAEQIVEYIQSNKIVWDNKSSIVNEWKEKSRDFIHCSIV